MARKLIDVTDITLTDKVCETVRSWLETTLEETGKKAIPSPKIFAALSVELQEEYPGVKVTAFNIALSKALKANRIKGMRPYLGKSGGIGRIDYKKPEVKPDQILVEVPAKRETSTLSIEGEDYTIDMSENELKKLLTKVIGLSRDDNGNITFGGESYSCDEDQVRLEYVKNFAFYFSVKEDDEEQSDVG